MHRLAQHLPTKDRRRIPWHNPLPAAPCRLFRKRGLHRLDSSLRRYPTLGLRFSETAWLHTFLRFGFHQYGKRGATKGNRSFSVRETFSKKMLPSGRGLARMEISQFCGRRWKGPCKTVSGCCKHNKPSSPSPGRWEQPRFRGIVCLYMEKATHFMRVGRSPFPLPLCSVILCSGWDRCSHVIAIRSRGRGNFPPAALFVCPGDRKGERNRCVGKSGI